MTKEDKLFNACRFGDLEQVKTLISQGADIHGRYPIRGAAYNGHLEVVKYLVEQGVDIHAQDDLVIRLSALNGHIEVVRYLYPHYSKETQKIVRDSLKTHPKYYVFLREVLV